MFQSTLRRLARELNARSIPYMIIGGQAVLVYGRMRSTEDIDVTLGIGPDEYERVRDVADVLGFEPTQPDAERFARQFYVYPCQNRRNGLRIDFILSFSPYERGAIARARDVDVGGEVVRYASPEDIVVHKIVAGRAQDLEDVKWILKKNPGVDLAYVRGWLHQYQEALDRPLLERLESVI